MFMLKIYEKFHEVVHFFDQFNLNTFKDIQAALFIQSIE